MKLRWTFFLLLLLSACDSNDSGQEVTQGLRTLFLDITNASPLLSGVHYEGWVTIISDGGASERSTGKFNVSDSGALVGLRGERIDNNLFVVDFNMATALEYSVTIEPSGDSDASPSNTRLLGGNFMELRAELTTSHDKGIDDRLSVSVGTYILASPTDTVSTNEDHGLWFINLTAGLPARGLRIPFPLQGWNYQGWVRIDGVDISTGVITGLSSPDDATPHSGNLDGFPYPGEDFLVNAPPGLILPSSVEGAQVAVTLEPVSDPDPARSSLEILNGTVPGSPTASFTYNLTNNINNLPEGAARISE